MMKKRSRYVVLAWLMVYLPLQAQENNESVTDPAAPPPLPPKVQGEQIEPSVNIRREEDRLVEEYSINGRVYMVKVTPKKGLPYYYFDEDGDGELELQPGDEALNPVRPVYWKVKEWK